MSTRAHGVKDWCASCQHRLGPKVLGRFLDSLQYFTRIRRRSPLKHNPTTSVDCAITNVISTMPNYRCDSIHQLAPNTSSHSCAPSQHSSINPYTDTSEANRSPNQTLKSPGRWSVQTPAQIASQTLRRTASPAQVKTLCEKTSQVEHQIDQQNAVRRPNIKHSMLSQTSGKWQFWSSTDVQCGKSNRLSGCILSSGPLNCLVYLSGTRFSKRECRW